MHGIMVPPHTGSVHVSYHQTLDQPMVGWYVGSLDMVLEEHVSGWILMMFFFLFGSLLLFGQQVSEYVELVEGQV